MNAIWTAIFIGLIATSQTFANTGGLAGDPDMTLAGFAGLYRGYSPTDESALAIGEMALTIGKETIKIEMATGLTILNEEIPIEGFTQMTRAELATFYNEGSSYIARSVGFKGPSGSPQLVFLRDPSTSRMIPARSEFGLIVRTGGMADYLGPTVLLTPRQLQKVTCESFLRSTEFWAAGSWRGGLIPRLSSQGRAPKQQ